MYALVSDDILATLADDAMQAVRDTVGYDCSPLVDDVLEALEYHVAYSLEDLPRSLEYRADEYAVDFDDVESADTWSEYVAQEIDTALIYTARVDEYWAATTVTGDAEALALEDAESIGGAMTRALAYDAMSQLSGEAIRAAILEACEAFAADGPADAYAARVAEVDA